MPFREAAGSWDALAEVGSLMTPSLVAADSDSTPGFVLCPLPGEWV